MHNMLDVHHYNVWDIGEGRGRRGKRQRIGGREGGRVYINKYEINILNLPVSAAHDFH